MRWDLGAEFDYLASQRLYAHDKCHCSLVLRPVARRRPHRDNPRFYTPFISNARPWATLTLARLMEDGMARL